MKRVLMLLLTICILCGNSFVSNAEGVLDENLQKSTDLVTMKPTKKTYVCYSTDKVFTPNKKVKKEAKKIYKKMKAKKQIKIKYKDTDKNTEFWDKVYNYLNTKYFPYEHINYKDSYVEGDYMIDIIGKNEYKRLKKMNKQISNTADNLIKELGIDKTTTKVEAIVRINEWMRQNCSYAFYMDEYNPCTNYHMLMYKEGICQDYSYTVKILCDKLGIKCGVVSDIELSHAYNVCIIDGTKYYVDTTWNKSNNDWLLLTEEEILARGRRIDEIEWYLY